MQNSHLIIMEFAVTIPRPSNSHESPFREAAEILHYGLLSLGYSSTITYQTYLPNHFHLLLGAQVFNSEPVVLSPNTIIYNSEPIDSDPVDSDLLELWRRYPVWDSSAENVKKMVNLGCHHVEHLPLGYVPQLTRLPAVTSKTIDVLLCHSSPNDNSSDRYQEIAAQLNAQGLSVESAIGVYGRQRDYLMCHSHICLNIHPLKPKSLDTALITYLLSNRQFVVAEYGYDSALEELFASGIALTSTDDLVDICKKCLSLPDYRQMVATSGFNVIQQRHISQFLSHVLKPIVHRFEQRKWDDDGQPVRVDLGCGSNKKTGFIGVDIYSAPGIDVVADLNQTFPFSDNSVDEVRAHDSIEHLHHRIHTMNELWRICKPNAVVDIFVPSTDGRGAFQDPTHVSFWNVNSFKYYSSDYPYLFNLCHGYGFKGNFKILDIKHVISQSDQRIIHVHVLLQAVKDSLEDRLREKFGLRRFNLLVRPDWLQPIEDINQDLVQLVTEIKASAQSDQVTLLVDRGNAVKNQEINLEEFLYDIALQVLLSQEVSSDQVDSQGDELAVSIVDPLTEQESETLVGLLQGCIRLSHTSAESSIIAKLETVNTYDWTAIPDLLKRLEEPSPPDDK